MKKSDIFKKQVSKWQIKLGLLDWEIHIESGKSNENRGWIESNVTGRIATIFYNEKWIKTAGEKEIECVAFHELIELLLSPIFAELQVFYSEEYCQELAHRIIRTMENVVFGNGA